MWMMGLQMFIWQIWRDGDSTCCNMWSLGKLWSMRAISGKQLFWYVFAKAFSIEESMTLHLWITLYKFYEDAKNMASKFLWTHIKILWGSLLVNLYGLSCYSSGLHFLAVQDQPLPYDGHTICHSSLWISCDIRPRPRLSPCNAMIYQIWLSGCLNHFHSIFWWPRLHSKMHHWWD